MEVRTSGWTPQLFCRPDDEPADLLDNAAAVTAFLSEAAVSFGGHRADHALSESGVHGLIQILSTIEGTIKHAITKL